MERKMLKSFFLPPEEHKLRGKCHLEAGKLLKKSVEEFDFSQSQGKIVADLPLGVPLAIEPEAAQKIFGAVNTLQKSGCVVYVSYYIMKRYNKIPVDFTVYDWTDIVAAAGYRSWRFSNYPKKTFFSPKIDVEEVKTKFPELPPSVSTVEEIKEILGKVEGIGGSAFLLDTVISQMAGNIVAVKDTRLNSVDGIINNLKKNVLVPIRVNNSVYHSDQNRIGGHYVTIYGLDDIYVNVFDSSIGKVMLPFKKIMNAAIHDKDLIAAWDLSQI